MSTSLRVVFASSPATVMAALLGEHQQDAHREFTAEDLPAETTQNVLNMVTEAPVEPPKYEEHENTNNVTQNNISEAISHDESKGTDITEDIPSVEVAAIETNMEEAIDAGEEFAEEDEFDEDYGEEEEEQKEESDFEPFDEEEEEDDEIEEDDDEDDDWTGFSRNISRHLTKFL